VLGGVAYWPGPHVGWVLHAVLLCVALVATAAPAPAPGSVYSSAPHVAHEASSRDLISSTPATSRVPAGQAVVLRMHASASCTASLWYSPSGHAAHANALTAPLSPPQVPALRSRGPHCGLVQVVHTPGLVVLPPARYSLAGHTGLSTQVPRVVVLALARCCEPAHTGCGSHA